MDLRVLILLLAEALFAFGLLRRAGLLEKRAAAVGSALLLALAFGLRLAVLPYETLDYQNFLTKWVTFFRENGGFRALAVPVGNYNIPYLYFLALFSYANIRDLYLIKLLSIFFDVVLAWACMQLAGLYTPRRGARLGCFFAVLFLPTVYLNGAVWGQCDSIYVAFGVLGLYLALSDRPVLSMVCAALSFGFKLQAVFLLPVYAVLWMQGKFQWKHFLVFPAAYVALVLPAVLLGRPFLDTLTLYLSQTGSVGDGLNYNSPSVFAFFREVRDPAGAARFAVAAAFCFMLAVLELCLIYRRRLNGRAVLGAALLLCLGVPFLLPHMHDRYFFAADILFLILAFVDCRYAFTAVLVQFASLLGYHAYLKMRYLLPMSRGALALILALLAAAVFFGRALAEKEPGSEIAS